MIIYTPIHLAASAAPAVTPQATAGSAFGIAPKAATTVLAHVTPLPQGYAQQVKIQFMEKNIISFLDELPNLFGLQFR